MRIADNDKTGGFNSPGGYMTNPVEGLNPLKKISWTIWNLDEDGNIVSWLGTRSRTSTKELLLDTGGEWASISADTEAIDNNWSAFNAYGIVLNSAKGKPFLLHVPNVENAFMKE